MISVKGFYVPSGVVAKFNGAVQNIDSVTKDLTGTTLSILIDDFSTGKLELFDSTDKAISCS